MEPTYPPLYSATPDRDVLPLIAPYLDRQTLCAATLVSLRWNSVFTRELYGNPFVHFSAQEISDWSDEDRGSNLSGLVKAFVSDKRRSLLDLCHTLHFPPEGELKNIGLTDGHQLFDSLYAVTVKMSEDRLSRLQSLILCGGSLTLLDVQYSARIRLLVVRGCDISWPWLDEALALLPSLSFLDLSYSKMDGLLSDTSNLFEHSALRVLKLRSTHLSQNKMFEILCHATSDLSCPWRSLDLRDNCHISSKFVDRLPRETAIQSRRLRHDNAYVRQEQDIWDTKNEGALPLAKHFSTANADIHFAEKFASQLTSGFVKYEESSLRPGGHLTDLYMSGNGTMTSDLAKMLLCFGCWKDPDGSIDAADTYMQVLDLGGLQDESSKYKIAWYLNNKRYSDPKWLRIDHSIVVPPLQAPLSYTRTSSSSAPAPPWSTRTSSLSAPAPPLSTVAPPPRPGILTSLPIRVRPTNRRSGPSSSLLAQPALPSVADELALHYNAHPSEYEGSLSSPRRQVLNPRHIPYCSTLVLTDIPALDASGEIIKALQTFIAQCASAVLDAKRMAQAEHPMDSPRAKRDRSRRSKKIFALDKIVLEVEAEGIPGEGGSREAGRAARRRGEEGEEERGLFAMDEDVQALRESAADDYSFFAPGADEASELMLPLHSRRQALKKKLERVLASPAKTEESSKASIKPRNVVHELSEWRRERERAWAMRADDADALGHWSGIVHVVRVSRDDRPLYEGWSFRH